MKFHGFWDKSKYFDILFHRFFLRVSMTINLPHTKIQTIRSVSAAHAPAPPSCLTRPHLPRSVDLRQGNFGNPGILIPQTPRVWSGSHISSRMGMWQRKNNCSQNELEVVKNNHEKHSKWPQSGSNQPKLANSKIKSIAMDMGSILYFLDFFEAGFFLCHIHIPYKSGTRSVILTM